MTGDKKSTKSCYMCDAPATTSEHAPPRCFFPEPKDVNDGTDYRKNLITVPSCDAHNTATAMDDEYAMVVVAAHFENNAVAGNQYATKILRALQRKASLVKAVFVDARKVSVGGRSSYAFRLDDDRFERVMEKVARAVHFHETGEKWTDPIRIHATGVRRDDMSQDEAMPILAAIGKEIVTGLPARGENPTVFRYQLSHRDAAGFRLLRMEFYEGLEVFALSGPQITDT